MDDDDRRNDLYCFDIMANKWDILPHLGDAPSPRSGARGIAYKDYLLFFGGYSKQSGEYYDDFYSYDLKQLKWEKLLDHGDRPGKRTDHSMTLYGNSIYIFGGCDGQNRLGDLYKCSILKDFKWKQLKPSGESQPLNRFGHSAVVIDHKMILFGGWNG
jgi:N-acetylneuraminic acid mutarotase